MLVWVLAELGKGLSPRWLELEVAWKDCRGELLRLVALALDFGNVLVNAFDLALESRNIRIDNCLLGCFRRSLCEVRVTSFGNFGGEGGAAIAEFVESHAYFPF